MAGRKPSISSVVIMDERTTTGVDSDKLPQPINENMTFQSTGQTTAGVGAATIEIQGSLDSENWLVLGTITLVLGTVTTNDGFAINAPWRYIRSNLTAISGTGAAVSTRMGG